MKVKPCCDVVSGYEVSVCHDGTFEIEIDIDSLYNVKYCPFCGEKFEVEESS